MTKTFPAPAAFSEKPRPPIALTPVVSNQVGAIGYDAETKTLAVQFTRGAMAIYHYPNVEPETHAAFVGAESIGTFFGKHIKPLAFEKFAPPEKKAEAAPAAPVDADQNVAAAAAVPIGEFF